LPLSSPTSHAPANRHAATTERTSNHLRISRAASHEARESGNPRTAPPHGCFIRGDGCGERRGRVRDCA
jgi:hypothetical protein